MTCPAPIKGFRPRAVQSPSAIRAYATCPRMWGHESLEGRRSPDVDFFALPPKPPAAPKGASAVEKARAKKALKAWNKVMRPAQGTALHAIYEAYYRQKVPGAWHPPMVWRSDLAAAWHSRPGQIALSGRQHLPNPEDLAEVWIEELVSLNLHFLPAGTPAAFDGSTLLIGGTPDLVTRTKARRVVVPRGLGGGYDEIEEVHEPPRFHLYDYKSTVSIDDYAKTADELLEDEQAAIYSLAVMQRHGLDSLDCTWLYFQTDESKPARSMPVHFTMTRAHAEKVVARIVGQAQAMAEVQARYLAERPGLLGRRLEIINSLDTNDMACDNFAGCVFHNKRPGGFCKPRKSTLGEALNKQAAEKKKTTARREASKLAKQAESRAINMAETFKEKQARLKAEREAAAAGGGAADKPADVEAAGEDVTEAPPAEKPASAPAKPKATAPKADDGAVTCSASGYTLELPAKSPLYKAIVKACKAQQAADAAIMGE